MVGKLCKSPLPVIKSSCFHKGGERCEMTGNTVIHSTGPSHIWAEVRWTPSAGRSRTFSAGLFSIKYRDSTFRAECTCPMPSPKVAGVTWHSVGCMSTETAHAHCAFDFELLCGQCVFLMCPSMRLWCDLWFKKFCFGGWCDSGQRGLNLETHRIERINDTCPLRTTHVGTGVKAKHIHTTH